MPKTKTALNPFVNIRFFTRTCLVSAIVFASTLAPTTAATDILKLKYDFYGSKFHLLSASYDLSFDKKSYLVKTVAKTKGVANMFAKSTMHFGARGIFTSRKPFPEEFQTRVDRKSKSKSAHIIWQNKNNQNISAVPKVSSRKQADVDTVLKASFPDPLSALLNITFSAKNPCSTNIKTYDGRKVFQFKLKYLGKEHLNKGTAGDYVGPSLKCMFKTIPIAGYSTKKMKAYRKNPSPGYTIWFAPLKSVATGKTFYIPVKLDGVFKSASITGLLKSGTYNDHKLSASQQTAKVSNNN